MSAYFDKNYNNWYYVVRIKNVFGKWKQHKKRGFKTKRQALEAERLFLIENATASPSSKLFEAFRHYVNHKKTILKPTTLQSKDYRFKKHIMPTLGHLKLNDITPIHCLEWYNLIDNNPALSNYSKKSILSDLVALLDYCVIFLGLKVNHAKKLPTYKINHYEKKKNTSGNIWTTEEFKKGIQSVTNLEIKTLLTLAFYTGLRRGELLGLTWEDFDEKNKVLHIRKNYQRLKNAHLYLTLKNNRPRSIKIPTFIVEELKEHRSRIYDKEAESPIFYVTDGTIQKYIEIAYKQNNLPPITLHGLRHAHASELFRKGYPITFVSERLGHAKLSTTLDIYTHLTNKDRVKWADELEHLRE